MEFERNIDTAEETFGMWLNTVYGTINEAYYEGCTMSCAELNYLRGVVAAAAKMGELDIYEADILNFQIDKIEARGEACNE